MTDTNPENEPSMEEILASIRRIISDGEDEGDADVAAGDSPEVDAAPAPGPPAERLSAVPSGEPAEEPEEDILDLTQMVTEQGEVVDLNEAKSARGLMAAAAKAEAPEAPEEDLEVEVSVDEVTRAVEALAQSMAESESEEIEAVAVPSEEFEDPALDLVEDDAPAEDAGQVAAEPVEMSSEPEPAAPASEAAVEETASELDALTEIEAVIDPESAAAESAPRDGESEALEGAPIEDGVAPLDLEAKPPSADETLSEIDQILARAREAAEAQAAMNVEMEAKAPESGQEDAGHSGAGFEDAENPAEQAASGQETAAGQMGADEADPNVMLEDIRAAVEESLGLGSSDPTDGGAEAEAIGSAEHASLDVEAETEALLAGLEARVRPEPQEQDVSSRKDSDLDFGAEADSAAGGSESGLVSTATAAGAIAALGDLARMSRESPDGRIGGATPLGANKTLEEMVVDAIAPHLKAWLDANLEPLVERIVREEIQRLRRRSENF